MNETQSHSIDREVPQPPPMCDAWLDEDKITELFDDLAGCTEIIAIQVKASPQVHVGEAQITLASARELVCAGQVRGVQIRYRFRGREWCDTIMCLNGRHRLIRCQYA